MKKRKPGRPRKKKIGRPKGSKNHFKWTQIGNTVKVDRTQTDAYILGAGILELIKALKA